MANKPTQAIWAAPIIMLLAGLLYLPYGYYTLLRIVCTGCSGYIAHLEYKRTEAFSTSAVIFVLLATLFNPIIPVYFSKSIWSGIDILTAIIFGIHAHIYSASENKS